MKIRLTKLTFANGDFSIDTDYESNPFSKIIKEEEMEIEIDNSKWKCLEESKTVKDVK